MVLRQPQRLPKGVLPECIRRCYRYVDPDRPRPSCCPDLESQIAANIARKGTLGGSVTDALVAEMRSPEPQWRSHRDRRRLCHDDAHGQTWHLMLGDSCGGSPGIPDDSVHLSVYSPVRITVHVLAVPARPRQLPRPGEVHRALRVHHREKSCEDSVQGRVARPTSTTDHHETARVRRADRLPGRHPGRTSTRDGSSCGGDRQQRPSGASDHARRRPSCSSAKNRDSSATQPALADYLLLFRRPGDNPCRSRRTSRTTSGSTGTATRLVERRRPTPLNTTVARRPPTERHICPLQLDFIRTVRQLWSNQADGPVAFAGIGSGSIPR